ncbi:hypothetical protein JMJ77_0012424 [Colletotrichum scovillei]|uniref:Uncharacterized protein n=1 Tax=Colletotrichum scovillei TaxID=1209932 RepID=A0A9P7U6Y4_9PEZI|nr:hypothetical protein JMJ78_0001501 [Colletotrichum scovillei]KAG7041908.1 hypothetical protein JMJ77_0012424 [Colletotrichum scovillei]KAG7061940.1 hypothetical protein JMJ76_0003894 [Colletotrichum scovillei]
MEEDIGPAEEGSHTRDLTTRFWASVSVTIAFTEMGYPGQDMGLGLCEEGHVGAERKCGSQISTPTATSERQVVQQARES